ncbi:MAG: colicin import membrane protein [Glaciecola sp.]|jgi:colicin import membrane protein
MKPDTPNVPDNKTDGRPDQDDGMSFFAKYKSFLLSGGAHLLLVLSLLLSFEFSAKPVDLATGNKDTQAPNIIAATFIDSNVLQQNKLEKQQAEAAAKRKRNQVAENKRKDEKRKQAERDKAKRLKVAQDKKRKEEQVRKENALKEKARLTAEKNKQDKAEKERQDKLAKERAQQDNAMQKQLQGEQAERNERRQRQILSELQIATGKIKARIEQNLITTGSVAGKSCRLQVRIASNGLVLDAVGKGDDSLCLTLRSAALRAGTLPMPADKDVNTKLRDVTLVWVNE